MLAQTTLRNILGTRTLSGILSEREQVSNEVLSILDTATDPWGIAVERNRDLIANIIFVIYNLYYTGHKSHFKRNEFRDF